MNTLLNLLLLHRRSFRIYYTKDLKIVHILLRPPLQFTYGPVFTPFSPLEQPDMLYVDAEHLSRYHRSHLTSFGQPLLRIYEHGPNENVPSPAKVCQLDSLVAFDSPDSCH